MNLLIRLGTLAICGLVSTVSAFAEDETAKAVNRLNDNWAERSLLLSRQSSGASTSYINSGEVRARVLRQEGQEAAERMRRSYYSDHNGHRTRIYTPEQIKAVEDGYERRAMAELESASQRSTLAQKEFLKRQDLLKQSAMNLQEQLLTKPSPADSIILAPQGTNLYVRNYLLVGEQFDKMPHVQPMRAVQQVISGAPVSVGAKGANYVRTSVKGELLK